MTLDEICHSLEPGGLSTGKCWIESEHAWGAVVMAEDFEQKYVAIVAGIIGGAILLLGLIGILWSLG